ncbi:MAG: hypothetical protein J4G19_09585 [Pseudomonadales bacterium]|nr:hypothetical protein [Pseudomonadales bacterium]
MERLSEAVLRIAKGQVEGTPLLAKGLLHLGTRAAVDQVRGEFLRLGRGVYVLAIQSRLGRRAPSVEKTIARLADACGERIAISGAMAANALGLTTQVPVKRIFLTSGSSRILTFDSDAPSWQLALCGRRSGDAIRALAWLGQNRIDAVVEKVRERLSAEELQEIASVSAQMPGWLAERVSVMAHS